MPASLPRSQAPLGDGLFRSSASGLVSAALGCGMTSLAEHDRVGAWWTRSRSFAEGIPKRSLGTS
jgi:hypothetical protein